MTEIKTVVKLDGVIINVGEWDYQITLDDLGAEKIGNPLPDGAFIEEVEMSYSDDYGWREVGFIPVPNDKERIEQLENMILMMMEVM